MKQKKNQIKKTNLPDFPNLFMDTCKKIKIRTNYTYTVKLVMLYPVEVVVQNFNGIMGKYLKKTLVNQNK